MKTEPNATYLQRVITSPIGTIRIVADSNLDRPAIVAILWDIDAELAAGSAHNPVERHFGVTPIRTVAARECAVLDAAASQLDEYFAGHRTDFDLPLAPIGTEFQQQAWTALRAIPFGTTVSYGHQAKLMGDARKARAVGAANGKNPIPIVVPCHRVVGSDGSLTGFAGGVGVKAWLLDHEQRVLTQ